MRNRSALLFAAIAASCADATSTFEEESPPDASIAAALNDASDPLEAISISAAVTRDPAIKHDPPTYPDAAVVTEEEADAGVAEFNCGSISNRCNDGVPCADPQHHCSSKAGVCLPLTKFDCGGFSKVQCPSDIPVCIYFQDTDYGVCVLPEVHDCICDTPAGRANFFC